MPQPSIRDSRNLTGSPASRPTPSTPCRWGRHALGALALCWSLSACSRTAETQFDCSSEGRKAYIASIMTEFYLWYDRVPAVDYQAAESPEALMEQLTYRELDHWSGIQQQQQRTEFFDQGRFQGFGYTLGDDPEGKLRVSWVHEGSAAGRAGLDRGALIIGVNGREVAELSSRELGAELGKELVLHRIEELDGTIHDVELRQGDVDITSVKGVTVLDSPHGKLGYLMFTTFVRPGEDELRAAFETFREQGVTQLVIDLRYNGGGLLSTAALLGSLIAGDAEGQPLIVETYNDQHPEWNRRRLMFDTPEALAVPRVVFLTTGRTASASEQVINGLTPYLRVDVVGSRTLGKPVGADSWSHCGYAISPITFHSLNAEGEGDYFQGIQPVCEAPDDLLHRLGDPEEAQLAAALRLLDDRGCAADDELSSSLPGDSERGSAPSLRPTSARSVRAAPLGESRLPEGPLPELPGWY